MSSERLLASFAGNGGELHGRVGRGDGSQICAVGAVGAFVCLWAIARLPGNVPIDPALALEGPGGDFRLAL